MIVANCLAIPFVVVCLHRSFRAFKAVSLEARRDGSLSKHLSRFGVDCPEMRGRIEKEAFTVSAASEFTGQVLLCAFVGCVWCLVLMTCLVLLFAYDPIRHAILESWELILWLAAALVLDQIVVQRVLIDQVLTDGKCVRPNCRLAFAVAFPILQIWYVFVGIATTINRFTGTLFIHTGAMMRTDVTMLRKDTSNPDCDGGFGSDRAFASFCASIRFWQWNLLHFSHNMSEHSLLDGDVPESEVDAKNDDDTNSSVTSMMDKATRI
eukprot:TRINITY_DN33284_c0_g1_i1.p1 TRINITY_DN33284_c0_g1~~TRINITY_DN33284_c0_g1_i1.p1  ORF type:complete len:266 (+),score=41.84 TRINITY_DN33284_c0_g1_i1:258-1055(+)